MPTIAYLANIFPSSVEPYVIDEICALQTRSITVIPCSALRPQGDLGGKAAKFAKRTVYLRPLKILLMIQACLLFIKKSSCLAEFIHRALHKRNCTERRLRALTHTALGVYYAALLRNYCVDHIHVHHGYFGSWVAMVAARLLNIPFSMTLHGSDLLANKAYLDLKLRHCQFCVTISEFNRRYILEHYPEVDPGKVYVRRLGVDRSVSSIPQQKPQDARMAMLAVGRLHAVKDHAFLVRTCHQLKNRGLRFGCAIAGEGPERQHLEALIHDLHLEQEVRLLGLLARDELDREYGKADLVVLTSQSEGIPLALMEAMALEKLVLAPAITGIPELVVDGTTGFLYRPGSAEDFIAKLEILSNAHSDFTDVRRNAREHVSRDFNRLENLSAFCNLLLAHLQNKPDQTHTAA
jgi:colanic acid/amylovoran biosynthesis glycosyltransferase